MALPQLFSIGEMAKIFHLSVSSLRHYEALGLVTPEYVDPSTNYRYYSVRESEPPNTIRYPRAPICPCPMIVIIYGCITNNKILHQDHKPGGDTDKPPNANTLGSAVVYI